VISVLFPRINKKIISQTLGVSRSSIYWKAKDVKMRRYKKEKDESVFKEILKILKFRPTYGYKRITAILNKERLCLGFPAYNKKRIHRVMELNGLLLSNRKKVREHQKTGKIETLLSNTRWCSDGFEVHAYNGEKVFVAFSLDCHDREAISYVANARPLLATDIQDLMIMSVEKRFNKIKAPREIQWLSDRGSIYRALETQQLGRNLGLKSCFTAAHSPESNGMAEAFVGTIKRDYVYTSDCFSAKEILEMLPKWFEDYNKNAPHSALGMKSPWEYLNKLRPELVHEHRSWMGAGGDHEGLTTTRMGVSRLD
jgi:putative transposase